MDEPNIQNNIVLAGTCIQHMCKGIVGKNLHVRLSPKGDVIM